MRFPGREWELFDGPAGRARVCHVMTLLRSKTG